MSEIVNKNLPVKLTNEEKIQIGKEIADLSIKIEDLADEKKSAAAQYKSKIDSSNALRREKTLILSSGEEIRSVECKIVYNYPVENNKSYFRLDVLEQFVVSPELSNPFENPEIHEEALVETVGMLPSEIEEFNQPKFFDKENDLDLENIEKEEELSESEAN